ncbi:hypothetical protein [Odoribacter sp. Z80]|jgi:hypothetical protein|uniref:hypothetical protein n=1 Tax=Odoribacter sp. Z80 TaxID=2304575 RepID=UPI00137B3D15|nr:hypothetical protein [Odoribacter sp. Z80]NCE73174.1 hypothetical protein [Odoribacter sp. Z80]
MNRQRLVVIVLAVTGMIATFLPWYRIAQAGTLSGISSFGWFTFIMFLIVVVLALCKNLREPLGMGVAWSIGIVSFLASFIMLWRMTDVWFAREGIFSFGTAMESVPGSQISMAYASWMIVAVGILIPCAVYLFRKHPWRRV